ncbi:MAG: hypothetical protein ACRCZI_00075, partial [Cetobacterium sp.]
EPDPFTITATYSGTLNKVIFLGLQLVVPSYIGGANLAFDRILLLLYRPTLLLQGTFVRPTVLILANLTSSQ